MNNPHKSYDDTFYGKQMDGSYKSATKIVGHLYTILQPTAVVDMGCGRGTWLKAFQEKGAKTLRGIDGAWNTQDDMIDQQIVYQQEDLNNPDTITVEGSFDLLVSLEVAEHLKPDVSEAFARKLSTFADAVLFSAAYVKQGGKDHINERPHSYWATEFAKYGFQPYDLFRPVFWGDPDVRFWYQQNCFLYAKDGTPTADALAKQGLMPMRNLAFMDCIHPRLYGRYTKPPALKRLKAKIEKKFSQS